MRKQLVFAQFGAAVRRKGALVLGLVMCTLGPGLSARAQQGTFTTFDAPGAGTAGGDGTLPFAINPAGDITGYYIDANFVAHGFVRAPHGTFATFDAPDDVGGTFPSSINPAGAITGYYCDRIACHGFLRDREGTITTFDAPDDVGGTAPSGINPAGVVTGTYHDANFVGHGFLRDRDGTITTFDAPGAGTGIYQGTFAVGIDLAGAVSGCYFDAKQVGHGFVRARDGALTTFDVPNSTDSCGDYYYSIPGWGFPSPGYGISRFGAITGAYFEPIQGNPFGGNYRGFMRDRDGTFTTFDAATYPPCCIFTFGIAINPAGVIAGYQNDGYSVNHGFLRARDGTITTLDAPGAGTGFYQGTIADGINPAGRITGWYLDKAYVVHGFLWIP